MKEDKKKIGYMIYVPLPKKGKVQNERLKSGAKMALCLYWLNQQRLPKSSPNPTNQTAGIVTKDADPQAP